MVLKKLIKKATKKATKKAVAPKQKPFKNIYTGKKLPKNVKDLILKRSKALKKTQKDFMIKKAISEKPIKAAIRGLKIGITRDEDKKMFPRYAPLVPSEKRGLKTRFNQVGGKRKLGITFDEFKDFYRYNSNRNTFLASKEVIINGEKHNVFIDFKKHNAIDIDKKALANFRKKGDIKLSNEKKGKK